MDSADSRYSADFQVPKKKPLRKIKPEQKMPYNRLWAAACHNQFQKVK